MSYLIHLHRTCIQLSLTAPAKAWCYQRLAPHLRRRTHIVTTSLSLALLALVTGMSLALLAFVVGIVASISWQRAHLPHGLAAPHASTCASDDSSFALRSLRVSICACSAALVPCCFISTALSRCTTAVSERSLDAYAPGTL